VINSGYVALKANDYTQLMNSAVEGPTAISIAAGSAHFKAYHGGIISNEDSCGSSIDHAVQLVGYGVDDSVMYWLVRNSWTEKWGEKGYVRMKRFGEGNEPCKAKHGSQTACGMCGILSASSYPTGVSRNGEILV